MLCKELIVIFGFISLVNSQLTDIETMYLNFFVQLESVKKSVDILKLQLEMQNDKPRCPCSKPLPTIESVIKQEEAKDKARNLSKYAFDICVDTLPAHCNSNDNGPPSIDIRFDSLPTHSNTSDNGPPSNCAEATDCTHANGFYSITVSDRSFLAFCDIKFLGGDWLYILRRQDGSENFQRPWSDYVNGFGDVVREYWIGLENLYALTNFDGPQELYVYIEDWEGETRYAKYDYFVIGNATEKYKIKTLGRYSGDAGDMLSLAINTSFYSNDLDKSFCHKVRSRAWWEGGCNELNPTGIYYKGGNMTNTKYADGIFWMSWKDRNYSHKTMNFMIRRQKL